MPRTPRRPRLLVAAVSVALLGVLFATDARAAIDPGRDENLIKHDGRGYKNPHAGFVAPQRGAGRLAPSARVAAECTGGAWRYPVRSARSRALGAVSCREGAPC